MTESAQLALAILRDAGQWQWYVIPLLTLVTLVYATEIERRNWNVVFAGLTYLGLDLGIEIVNSLVFHVTQYAPIWGTPGQTAYLLLIGMNIEIFFMFALVGIVFAKLLPRNKRGMIWGIPNRWVVTLGAALACATVEVTLNGLGVLTWEYPWWNRGLGSIGIVGGYGLFFRLSFWVHDIARIRRQATVVGALFALDLAAIVIFGLILHWI